MKFLFLDIDGVVNHSGTNFKTDLWPLERYSAFLVGKIQLDTDCKVILSSSWRHHPEAIPVIEKHVVPIHDKTGSSACRIRGVEIHEWLTKNVPGFYSDGYKKGEHKVAILDDDSDMLLWQKDCFFQTDFNKGGLTDEIAAAVIHHLNS